MVGALGFWELAVGCYGEGNTLAVLCGDVGTCWQVCTQKYASNNPSTCCVALLLKGDVPHRAEVLLGLAGSAAIQRMDQVLCCPTSGAAHLTRLVSVCRGLSVVQATPVDCLPNSVWC